MDFNQLNLNEQLLSALNDNGFQSATSIQQQAIPVVLARNNILASAQTGTGKTASFVLPLLEILCDKSIKGPSTGKPPIRALVVVPTRELALQVEECVILMSKYLKINSLVLIGGVSMEPQIKKLRSNVDVLISTPGRLLDHVGQGNVDLSRLQILVLDEADRMLNMGFIHDIRKIIKLAPANVQKLMFSATYVPQIKQLATEILGPHVEVAVASQNTVISTIEHKVYPVAKEKKRDLLIHLVKTKNIFPVIVFSATKHGANKLVDYLAAFNVKALAIHGNKSQNARIKALEEFKSGGIQVMVATDIAARGIDVSGLDYVINFDLPKVAEDYIHRIGRTGRNGNSGIAMSLVSREEQVLQRDIEKLLGQKLASETIEGFEPGVNLFSEVVVNNRRDRTKINPTQNKKVNTSSRSNNKSATKSEDTSGVVVKLKVPTSASKKATSGVKSPAAQQKAKQKRDEDRVKRHFFAAKPKSKA